MYWTPIDVSATKNLPDEATLTAEAATIKTRINTFTGHIADMDSAWKGLSGIYEAPAQQQVLTAMNKPKNSAEDLVDSGTSVKKALQDFASTAGDLKTKHNTLVGDISDAKALYAGSSSSSGSPAGPTMGGELLGHRVHAALVTRAKGLATDYTTAREKCVSDLKAVGRVTTDVTSHYAPGILDLVSNDAERLRRDASRQNSSVAQIRAYYAYLAKMTPQHIKAFAEDYPEAAVYGPRKSMPAREQVEFWNGLSPAQQAAMAASLPIIVGNTEGVRYAQRATANEEVLHIMRSGRFPTTAEQDQAYEAIASSLKSPSTEDVDRHLISFDPSTNKPLAGVSIGEIDEASSVTLNASGITSKTQGMVGETNNAQALWDEQGEYTVGSHAVVAWIGYDSPGGFPGSTEVNYTDKAQVGGRELATQLDGLHLTRAQDGGSLPRVNVGAHSYGTTMAGYALTQTEFDVDSVYFYGSAGLDPNVADSAEDLHVKDADNGRPAVYASQAVGDLVAPGGIFSSQFGDVPRISPTDDVFGAQVLDAEESVDEFGNLLKNTTGHGGHGNYDGQAPTNPLDPLYLIDLAKGRLEGLVETETGHGYLDHDTTSLHHYALVTSGETRNLDIKDQAITDTIIEEQERQLQDRLEAPGKFIDNSQRGTNVLIDVGKSRLDAAQDQAVGTANSGIDHAQSGLDSVTDRGQSLLSGATRTAREHLPFGLGDTHVAKNVEKGASTTFNGIIDDGQGLARSSVDTVQDGGNAFSELFKGARNAPLDGLQRGGNEAIDSAQRAVGDAATSVQGTVEEELREYSLTHRDPPTR